MTSTRNRASELGQASAEFGFGCLGLIAAAVLVLGFLSFHPVDAGYVGVVNSFGKVQPETLKPGSNFLLPIFNGVTNVDTRVHGIPFGEDNPATPEVERFGAASIEYQDVFLKGTLNIHIDQNKAVDLYQNVGLDYDQKLVIPFFTTAIKEVVPQYRIGDILAKREEIRHLTVEKLAAKLSPYGIVVDDVAIGNIDFSEQYKQAIEAKQAAEQQVLTEKQILAQKLIQADQAKAQAQGAADSRVIESKGNAEAALIEANAQAEVNRKIAASLTDEVIRYATINKLSPTISTMILPEGQSFILDPKALAPTPAQ